MKDRPTRNPWLVLLTLCLGQCLVLLDTTIVNVAIPSMTKDLSAQVDDILWVSSAYTLAYAVLLVNAGRLGDLYGQKPLFLGGVAVFTVASAVCGLAQTPGQLIVARVVQGVGAALLTPQSLSVISKIFEPERRGVALGVWGSVVGAAAAIGPTAGGLVIAVLDWRWIFFINLPLGALVFVLSMVVVPRLPGERRHSLDWLGTGLVTVGLFMVVYGLLEGEPHGWGRVLGPATAPELMAAGVLLLVLFVFVERGRQDREPLLPFEVLRDRNFTVMSLVVWALPCSLGAMLLLIMIYLQSALGMGAFTAGLTMATAPAISVFVSPISGRLIDRFGGKYVMIAGFALFAGGIGYFAVFARADASWWSLLPGLVIFGLGMGVAAAPPGAIAMRDVDPALSGAASGLFNMSRVGGQVVGGAVVGALLEAQLAARSVGLSPQTAADRAALADAVRVTYLFPVLALVVAVLVTTAARRPATVARVRVPEPQPTGTASE
ncbi:DHA2 family efflux MFS transporter permease subunit [Actinomadura meridiana]|uniref:DHA2 family efflux MFS transporter permease subunit n=1 Tax=Actinomadura meridiana TaxID=559626 RepID=A0ABP8CEW3_9ACTN